MSDSEQGQKPKQEKLSPTQKLVKSIKNNSQENKQSEPVDLIKDAHTDHEKAEAVRLKTPHQMSDTTTFVYVLAVAVFIVAGITGIAMADGNAALGFSLIVPYLITSFILFACGLHIRSFGQNRSHAKTTSSNPKRSNGITHLQAHCILEASAFRQGGGFLFALIDKAVTEALATPMQTATLSEREAIKTGISSKIT